MKTYISELVEGVVGNTVACAGWVHNRRNMGKLVFFDLRDSTGLLQVVCVPQEMDEASGAAVQDMRPEFVIEVSGILQKRGAKQINPDIPTGSIELLAKQLRIVSVAKTTPFEIENEDRQANEELRLKYRYLDLRHDRMAKNIVARANIIRSIRNFLSGRGFIEVETPILTKSTPEGARDYIVPSRITKGSFYALPQSPQQYKQLLMVAGIERYFQIARCFRDEDTRGDRQPEFTQLDLEMSFVEREDVMALNEELIIATVKECYPEKKIQEIPFPRLTYAEAMKQYGTDRPDVRNDKNDPNLLAFCWVIDFPFFEKTEEGGWTFTHNPFSAAKPEHQADLLARKNIGSILTTQYDVSLNGFEICGGSIRNHQREALAAVFEIIGFSADAIQKNFGHMLEAFDYGAPPHGGIAWGLDRFVMILQNEPNIREVIAFPKTSDGKDPMMDSPSAVSADQLKELGISVSPKKL